MSDDAEWTIDQLNRRLAEIAVALEGPAREPSPARFALLQERDSLRQQTARFRSIRYSSRTSSELGAELAELNKQLKRQIRSHTGYVTAKGGNNQGPSPGAWVKLAAQTRANSDIGRLIARIGEIESELDRRRLIS